MLLTIYIYTRTCAIYAMIYVIFNLVSVLEAIGCSTPITLIDATTSIVHMNRIPSGKT